VSRAFSERNYFWEKLTVNDMPPIASEDEAGVNVPGDTPKKPRSGLRPPWKKGESGNPRGQPRGSRHKASLIAECLLDTETKELIRKAIDLALGGDTVALRLCVERILPVARERPCSFKLPKIETLNDATAALSLLVEAVSNGEVLPGEAESLASVVKCLMQSFELAQFEDRLSALERAAAGPPSEGRAYDA
jgi:Family of unknown function (DUF5681)